MAIATLAYKIVLDTSEFTSGTTMTRKELAASRKLFEETRTPVERYEQSLRGLNELQKKGLNSDVVERSVKKLREEFWNIGKAAEEAEKPTDDLFAKIAGGVTVGNVLSKAFTAAFDVIRSGATALVQSVEQQFQQALKLGQIAERTGISSEALGGFELIAARSGMEFEKVANSLQKMQIRIGEAAAGGGDAAKVFERLGLSAKQLAGMSVDKQFVAISAAMRTIPTDTERLGAAAKIFEAEGTDIARLFGLTAEQMAKAREEAERMGIALDESQLNEIAKANEAIKDMELLWAGVGRTLAVEVAPVIESMLSVVSEARAQIETITKVKSQVETSMPGLSEGLKTGVMTGLASALPGSQFFMRGGAHVYGEYRGLVDETRAKNESELQSKRMEREQQSADRIRYSRQEQLTGQAVAIAAAMDMTFGLLGGKQQETNNWNPVVNTIKPKSLAGRTPDASVSTGPMTAVLKGTSEAFAAEQERVRVEDERYRESVKREQAKLEALNTIALNTKPENGMSVEVVGI